MTVSTAGLPGNASTGIEGLDEILRGGLPRRHIYLTLGSFGTGKTTLGLQFLLAGARASESGLYFTLAETTSELHQVAQSHGWSLEKLRLHELTATSTAQTETPQTVFPSTDVELEEMMETITDQLHRHQPDRVVFDSITELRLLAATSLSYRRHLLLLRQRLAALGCTTLLLSDEPSAQGEAPLESLVHGVMMLSRTLPEYGRVQRRLEVVKLRGVPYLDGYHDYQICTGGLVVFPRLQVGPSNDRTVWTTVSSGVAALDTLLGGGLETGTACLLMGQAGAGKSVIALLYAAAAARAGTPVAVFLFDERLDTWLHRAESLQMNLRPLIEQGLLHVHEINTANISVGEFAFQARQLVEQHGVKVIVVDSLSGYLTALPQQQLLLLQMHELLTYLGQQRVLTLLLLTQHGIVTGQHPDGIDLSYLADTVLLLRHFEADGALRQAISVVKKRHSSHERTIRELYISSGGVTVGPPLSTFSGVLGGAPRYEGPGQTLLENDDRVASQGFDKTLAPAEDGP
jgi:circadian clock protein KaiC